MEVRKSLISWVAFGVVLVCILSFFSVIVIRHKANQSKIAENRRNNQKTLRNLEDIKLAQAEENRFQSMRSGQVVSWNILMKSRHGADPVENVPVRQRHLIESELNNVFDSMEAIRAEMRKNTVVTVTNHGTSASYNQGVMSELSDRLRNEEAKASLLNYELMRDDYCLTGKLP